MADRLADADSSLRSAEQADGFTPEVYTFAARLHQVISHDRK